MKCDLCDKTAVVHEVTVRDGVKNEVHLCETHAQSAGIALPGNQPINQLLTQFVISKGATKPGRKDRKVCQTCGLSFSQFRQAGVLGCPECYDAFVDQLGPMIERAQNGGASHSGKCPRRCGASIDRQLVIRRLVKDLDRAIASEQYERAAELRDRLRELQLNEPAPAAAAPAGPAIETPKRARRKA